MKLGRPDRFCLDGFERVVIGRNPHVELRRPYGTYSRMHAALTKLDGRWQLADLGSSGGTYMNKKRIPAPVWLDPGDVFQMNGDEMFRYLEETVDPRWEAQARKVADGGDTDAEWLVFADALQDLGDPIGRDMMTAGAEPVLPLGFLDRMRSDDTVQFTCRYGFVRSLTLRNRGLALELQDKVVPAILAQPVVQLIRALEVDLTTFSEGRLMALLNAVRASAPPSLRRVSIHGVIGAPPSLPPTPYAVEFAPI